MLTEFSVKNYKCLADVTLPLTPIHVLIGQNDTGKTSLLEAMRALSRYVVDRPRGNYIQNLFPSSNNQRLFHDDKNENIVLGFGHDADNEKKFHLTLSQSDASLQRQSNAAAQRIEFPKLMISDASRFAHAYLCLQPGAAALPSELYDQPKYTLDVDGFGLATLLDTIKDYDVDRFRLISESFASYFPHFPSIRLENARAWTRNRSESQVVDNWNAKGKQVVLAMKDRDIPLSQASNGAIILLSFIALTYSPKPPGLLLIEEPENGLHPRRLKEIATLLREFTKREKNAPQIIITTHSPYLLSEFQPEEVTLMRRVDGAVRAFPLRDAKHIHERMGKEFYLGELWYNLDEEDLLK